MYSCTECGNHICEDHSHFGSDGLEQCARCNIRHERAEAGPPPPREEVGKADHPAKVGAEVMVMDMLHFHHRAWASRRRPRSRWTSWRPEWLGPSGGAPSTLVGGAPGFYECC